MGISRLLKGESAARTPTSRYGIVAAGGPDPEAAPTDHGRVADPLAPTSEPTLPSDRGAAAATSSAGAGVTPEIDGAEHERRRVGLEELVELMRPAVQMDGGDLAVVDVDYAAGIVDVELQGACGSCAISATTLKGGVERLLKERLDWVTEVRGGVDESVDPFESAARGRGAYVPRYY